MNEEGYKYYVVYVRSQISNDRPLIYARTHVRAINLPFTHIHLRLLSFYDIFI